MRRSTASGPRRHPDLPRLLARHRGRPADGCAGHPRRAPLERLADRRAVISIRSSQATVGGHAGGRRAEASVVGVVPRNWFNPNLIYQWFMVPNLIASIALLIGLIVTALSIARERELGTFDQLMVSPSGRTRS